MVRKQNQTGLIVLFIVFISSVVLAGLGGEGPESIDKMASDLYESRPNVIDSGGGKAASPNHMTTASIGQPMIGEASSSMYTNEAGFFTSDEDEIEVAGIIVTNTNDDGEGSLRWAITQANINAGPDTIIFNIPDTDPGYDAGAGVWTVQPLSQLPQFDDDGTVIDGWSQSDFIGSNTNPDGPEIELDGTYAGDANGLLINSAYNRITGLIINRFGGDNWTYGTGIKMYSSSAVGNIITGCYIGVDATGFLPLGNKYNGILISSMANANRIGGPDILERNIISGTIEAVNVSSGNGITISSSNDNTVIGNFIGTDRDGTGSLQNDLYGISIYQSAGNRIGGTGPYEGNIISGNRTNGLYLSHPGSMNNTVTGNMIGTDISGTLPLGNGGDGIHIIYGAHDNSIGPGNRVAFNGDEGISVANDSTTGNIITLNSIFSNTGLGIDNWLEGNTELDPPVITSVSETDVSGTACPGCIVEIFSDDEDEGEFYEGTVVADGSGDFILVVTVTGPFVTATATDSDSNTSEFSTPFAFIECERGDVNCDGGTTPGDALCAFWRSILGDFQEECDCDCSEQAADANCDGSTTPGDALCIFWRSILGDWTEECQCLTAKSVVHGPSTALIQIESMECLPGRAIAIPLLIKNPRDFDAFALRLNYPVGFLTFESISSTRATKSWIALEGVETKPGAVTIGGFHTEGISRDGIVSIVKMTFTVRQDAAGNGSFEINNLADDLAGVQTKTGRITVGSIPTDFSLGQNYPNPFNPTTEIRYQLSANSDQATHYTTLKIYNVLGQEVRTLVETIQNPGDYTVSWDGKDFTGRDVASGVYLYRLQSGEQMESKRMLLLK